jgi:hypothetical protein
VSALEVVGEAHVAPVTVEVVAPPAHLHQIQIDQKKAEHFLTSKANRAVSLLFTKLKGHLYRMVPSLRL